MVDDTSRDVMQRLIARGLSPVHAAALVGHGIQESSLNPSAYNPKEDAFGMLQWRLDRLDNLKRFASERGVRPDDRETQLDFIMKEMAGPESKAGGAFLAAKDLPSAHAALKRYIRYGDNSDATRLAHAQQLLGIAPTAVAATAPPFGLASASAEQPQQAEAASAMPLLALAKQTIARNVQGEDDEPLQMMEIATAKPLGLSRVRDLLAAMKKVSV